MKIDLNNASKMTFVKNKDGTFNITVDTRMHLSDDVQDYMGNIEFKRVDVELLDIIPLASVWENL